MLFRLVSEGRGKVRKDAHRLRLEAYQRALDVLLAREREHRRTFWLAVLGWALVAVSVIW
jgi:hypothetical protein